MVLLADNHTSTRRTLSKVLGLSEQIKVVGEARDGKEAIAKVRELHPEAILMDVKMPKMDGLQAAQQIRRHYPETKVIMLSAYNDEQLIDKATRVGAGAYLLKHNSIENIIQAILKECRKNQQKK